MKKLVTCPGCGMKITGDSDDELVKGVQDHSKKVHSELPLPSKDDVLAMAQPA